LMSVLKSSAFAARAAITSGVSRALSNTWVPSAARKGRPFAATA
jgi:hypothetical protein